MYNYRMYGEARLLNSVNYYRDRKGESYGY